jgi:hypothetical protein
MERTQIMKGVIIAASILAIFSCGSKAADPGEGDSWPMYGQNLEHTFSNPHSEIDPRTALRLKPAWTFPAGDAVTASPAVVGGTVFVGSWDGFFYALDSETGQQSWKFQLDCQKTVVPLPQVCGGPGAGNPEPQRFTTPGGIVTASAAVSEKRVFFAGGKTFYALSKHDGSLVWKRVICGRPEAPDCASDEDDPVQILSSPVVFDGKIFFGVSTGGVSFDIPYRGGFVALDAQTGALLWRFEVDSLPNGAAQNRGCGNVWSSPAVDAEHRLVFFGTADCEEQPLPPYHGSILALDADTGAVRWVFRPRESDPNKCDFDFGASPNLMKVKGHKYVGLGGKDGTYYVLDRLTGRPVSATRVVFGGEIGGFFGAAAFDGRRVFSGTAFGDGNLTAQSGLCDPNYHDPGNPEINDTFIQDPSLHALDVATGEVLAGVDNNQTLAATTLARRVVLSGFAGLSATDLPAVKVYDARSLGLLTVLPVRVNDVPGMVNSSVVPVGRMIFFGSGNFFDGGGSGVHAFRLP